MARVTLNLPEQFDFTHTIEVRTTDLNAGGHLGNDQMISLVSEARYRFLHHHGVDELSLTPPNVIVTDLAISYKAESFVQDRLVFSVGLDDINKYGGDVVFRVHKEACSTLVAEAKQGFVFFDYQSRKVCPIPDDFRQRVIHN